MGGVMLVGSECASFVRLDRLYRGLKSWSYLLPNSYIVAFFPLLDDERDCKSMWVLTWWTFLRCIKLNPYKLQKVYGFLLSILNP